MSVAGLVLGIIATALAVASLTWQVVLRLPGPRPQLTPVVGLLTPGGLVTTDGSRDAREFLLPAAGQWVGQLIVGVKVVNVARAPLRVADWAIRTDPESMSLAPAPIGGTEIPRDIPPRASAVFVTKLENAQRFAEAAARVDGAPPQIVLTVSSGSRSYVTKPVAPELLSLEPR
ncbi:MAG: hypothetical protein JO236_12295 [Mycobacterium sp.]|uniref:hypothetical protein n=1 Tax=Mycobacterium sp. TaxID=1785 RepID=UPI001ED5B12D|nr:hypothetical protein [Mycobacterium sp.]MBW0018309.1 hypothetical protein [Mycobacterium sp.]